MISAQLLEKIIEKTCIILDDDSRANNFLLEDGFLWISEFGSLPISNLSLTGPGRLTYTHASGYTHDFTLLTLLNTDNIS